MLCVFCRQSDVSGRNKEHVCQLRTNLTALPCWTLWLHAVHALRVLLSMQGLHRMQCLHRRLKSKQGSGCMGRSHLSNMNSGNGYKIV